MFFDGSLKHTTADEIEKFLSIDPAPAVAMSDLEAIVFIIRFYKTGFGLLTNLGDQAMVYKAIKTLDISIQELIQFRQQENNDKNKKRRPATKGTK